MLRRPLLAALVAAAAATLVAACGAGGSGTTTRSSTAPATVTRTVTSTPTTTSTPTSTTSPTTTASTASTADACVADDLALVSLGGSGATGHLLLGFGLRNTTSRPCETGGYPGVEFLDASGGALPTIPDHTTDDFFGHTVLRELTVAPGATVSFRLGVTDVPASGQSCVRARGLQVIPPNDTATLRLSREIFECGGRVSVSPLQAGTSALR